MGSWFLLKMFLMVAEEITADERGTGADKCPRALTTESSTQRTRKILSKVRLFK